MSKAAAPVPEKTHSELGASVASRWMACAGSVQLSRGIPNSDSFASREGTAAHALAELSLSKKADPEMWLGLTLEGIEVDEEMVEFVRVYVDFARTLIGIPGATHWIEKAFNLGALNPPGPMWGTGDLVVLDTEARRLHVPDLKYGRGVVVEVKGNKQVRYYALGALLSLPQELQAMVDDVEMYIVQPRAAHPDGVIRSEVISISELIDFSVDLMAAAKLTLEPNPPFKAGDHCRFCPASAVCPERRNNAQSIAQIEFATLPEHAPPPPETLPPEVLADILSKLPQLDAWMKAMRAYAANELAHNRPVDGFKLVAKRATRKWNDAEGVEQLLISRKLAKEETHKMDLKSPAQIEKLLGKPDFAALLGERVSKISSGYTMVPAHDPRPAAQVSAGEEFAAITAGDE